jgi:hypothetical protein
LPSAVAKHKDVDVAKGERQLLSLARADQMLCEPDDGGVAVNLDRELIERGRVDRLFEDLRDGQLLRLVAAAAVTVGHHELVGQNRLDELGVIAMKSFVPIPFELNQNVLLRAHRRLSAGSGGAEEYRERTQHC